MHHSCFLFAIFATLAATHVNNDDAIHATGVNKDAISEYKLHCGQFTKGCVGFCGCTEDGKLACHPKLAPERCSEFCHCRASPSTGIKL
ncbi:hypothetical protein PspLS_00146 [Pyricularia sp. CBS 133598]|nr:hypothetical protein PspLS_00146 [Pyricularia sp. CBS 133598]